MLGRGRKGGGGRKGRRERGEGGVEGEGEEEEEEEGEVPGGGVEREAVGERIRAAFTKGANRAETAALPSLGRKGGRSLMSKRFLHPLRMTV